MLLRSFLVTSLFATILGIANCKTSTHWDSSSLSSIDSSKFDWLKRSFRFLMNRPARDGDQLYLWLNKPEPEFIDHLMNQPDFANSMAELGLYFVGGLDERRESTTYDIFPSSTNFVTQSYPNVAAFAQAVSMGRGSYLDLFQDRFEEAPSEFPEGDKRTLSGEGFWFRLPNTRINRHRKQANYILSRYFCEDLTPISVPEMLSEDGHGKEKSAFIDPHLSKKECASCHFRLDPMAGFFRNHNSDGSLIEESKQFSDGSEVSDAALDKYLSYWQAYGSLADRLKWNVGYIQSSTDPSKNSYGSTVEDLFRIMRERREPTRCLIKRAGEKIFGQKQSIDSAWLNDIADRLHNQSLSNPKQGAIAFRSALTELLLSATFREAKRDPALCYDFLNQPTPNDPPCQVKGILESYCTGCHGPQEQSGGLDFTKWSLKKDYKRYSFFDQSGRPPLKVLQLVLRSIESGQQGQEAAQMPPEQQLDLISYQVLRDWLKSQIEEF